MAMHMLRPIHGQVDAENDVDMIDLLAGHKLNAERTDYLDLLSDLREKWESAQFPISRARGAELLRLVLAERGEKAGDLAKLLGIIRLARYRILRGERQLTARADSQAGRALRPRSGSAVGVKTINGCRSLRGLVA